MTIEVGQLAPPFALRDQTERVVNLADYAERTYVVIVFFPFAFTGASHVELQELGSGIETFEEAGAQLLGVSCDSPFTLARWATELDLAFPLLSDFWPHGEVAGRYGVLDLTTGAASRTTIIVRPDGTVADVLQQREPGTTRTFAEHRDALERVLSA